MQDFVQAFSARQPYPDKYDLLMDVATEEFSLVEIVGATITMLLNGINGELKNAAERSDLMKLQQGSAGKEAYIHEAIVSQQFLRRDLDGDRAVAAFTADLERARRGRTTRFPSYVVHGPNGSRIAVGYRPFDALRDVFAAVGIALDGGVSFASNETIRPRTRDSQGGMQ